MTAKFDYGALRLNRGMSSTAVVVYELTRAPCRMRGATILIINLKGLATEVIKNIVLAGIGKLIVMDGANVSETDLGAGFFFTHEDVGKNVRRTNAHSAALCTDHASTPSERKPQSPEFKA